MLSRADVAEAARRLTGLVRTTPCLRLFELESDRGSPLWAKCENLQVVGAFKARGAQNAALRLDAEQRARGLITYSSGNHAQAVALAASRHGVSADIAMPEDAPAVKVDSVRRLGARIHFAGTTSPERKAAAEALAARTGGTIIEPFDHPDIVCGQGTATLEFLAQLGAEGASIDTLVVPVGGGGLLAGACLAADPELEIVAVEPEGCDSLGRSLAAGEPTAVTPGPTLADGLKPSRVGALNFEIARSRGVRAVTVTDADIVRAFALVHGRAHLVIEPSAAAAVAVALQLATEGSRRGVGVLLSGGNVAPELVARMLTGEAG